VFGATKECEGCRLKDETIADLREQVREAHKTALAVIDAKAFALRFQAEKVRPAAPAIPEGPPLSSAADFRHQRYIPPLSSEEIEMSFALEAAERNRGPE
jgi:hypothetical protein